LKIIPRELEVVKLRKLYPNQVFWVNYKLFNFNRYSSNFRCTR